MAISYSLVLTLAGDAGTVHIGTAAISDLSTIYGTASLPLAAATARAIAAGFGASVTKRAGDVSINASDKFKHFMDIAKDLERQAKLYGLGADSVYAGGISKADKLTQEQDTDRVDPFFTRETHDDPGYDRDDLTGYE